MDDVLRLKKTVVTINGSVEEAIVLVRVQEGCDTCHVAFVPRVFAKDPKVISNINKLVQVVEIYKFSENSYKRRLSKQNQGMASVIFLDGLPHFE